MKKGWIWSLSVKVNDRKISDIEYENTYSKLYDYIYNKVVHMPNRHHDLLGIRVINAINDLYDDIDIITKLFFDGKKKSVDRYRICVKALKDFETLIKVTYTFWNLSGKKNEIKYVERKQRKFWSEFINKEIALLVGVASKCNIDKTMPIPEVRIYAMYKSDVKDVEFLNNLCELENIFYKRAVNSAYKYKDARLERLLTLTESAFYNASQGNNIKVDGDAKRYDKRKKYFYEAISNLFAMNRPMFEIAKRGVLNGEELEKVTKTIDDTKNILKAIQIYDEKQFKNLNTD